MIAKKPEVDVAIVGLGVIGGSAALRLQERGTAVRGFSSGARDCTAAQEAAISVTRTLDEAVRDVGLVLIAVPLDRISTVAAQVVGAAPPRATILHAGSLQRVEALRALPEIAARIVGTHPLAGSHNTVFIEARADARQREEAELFWSIAGARHIEYATAAAHDDAMAWISHLPQLTSKALAAVLARELAPPNDLPRLPLGPGARDTTRLAMSPLDMWQPILERAPAATLAGLRALESNVHRLRVALENQNWNELRELWESAREWRSAAEQGEAT